MTSGQNALSPVLSGYDGSDRSHGWKAVDMGESETKLTELQFTILDGMADDYEDVEQLYLHANRRFAEERQATIQSPLMLVEIRYPLRDIVDEIANMVREGYIEARCSTDEEVAPLRTVNFSALHHYWFGATLKGKQEWKAHSINKSVTG